MNAPTTTHHGSNKDCPHVVSGAWQFCRGHVDEPTAPTKVGHTPTPWRIIALDDGAPWLTDGRNFGMNPDAAPALLAALAAFAQTYERVGPDPNAWPDLHLAFNDARAALRAARGEAT